MSAKLASFHGKGRAVQSEHDGEPYWAWVPDPLPPHISFDVELANELAEAARAIGELAGTGRNLPNPHLLLSPFLRKEAVLSSRIEGTQATIADLYAYEAAQLPLPGIGQVPEDEADVAEVGNYVAALNRGLEIIRGYPISLALIEELHLHLMKGVRGREKTPGAFRQSQNVIGPAGSNLKTATYVPPPPVHMRDALLSLEAYIKAEDPEWHPLIRLALIHYQFEAIHPFNDGNGRVGRLLISLLVTHWNLLPEPLLYLSAYLERHRSEYYQRLQAVTERAEWREWIIFFLRGLAQQSVDAALRAKRLQDLRESLNERAMVAKLSAPATRLASRLVEQPVVTITSAGALIGAEYHNARRQVRRLLAVGILVPFMTKGNQDFYYAPDVLAAVSD